MRPEPLDLSKLKVLPLAERPSLTRADDILVPLDAPLRAVSELNARRIDAAAEAIVAARKRDASVMLIYGAHLLRNGAALLLDRMMADGWLTHLATNGAGTIHDWEYAWHGASTESVEMNVANGTFGTWDETAVNIHLAIMTGALDGRGYGEALEKSIRDDGATLPEPKQLVAQISADPLHSFTPARADLLKTMTALSIPGGRHSVTHRWKHASILASAYARGVPLTVHPGIGYDIISNHPIFSGAAIGRAGEIDFKQFGGAVARLDGGVVLNVGSAIMGPQVFEKTISCVNNLRLQSGQNVINDAKIFVVDIQDGGGWDWTQGEPPKTNPAYYLRFCKSYSRMGGAMQYLQCDNLAFVQQLLHRLRPTQLQREY